MLFYAVFHYCNIFCQISTAWRKHQAQSYQQWTFPFPELNTASEPRNWKQQSAFDIHFESVTLSFSTTKSSDCLFTVSSCCTNSIPYKHEALVVYTGQDTEYEPQSPGTELEGFKLPGSGWQVRQCRENIKHTSNINNTPKGHSISMKGFILEQSVQKNNTSFEGLCAVPAKLVSA